mgnify:CR=1 FL=1
MEKEKKSGSKENDKKRPVSEAIKGVYVKFSARIDFVAITNRAFLKLIIMSTIKSGFKIFKIGFSLFLISTLTIIIAQNVQPVDVEVLFWELHIPLVFLLLGTALFSAMVVFFTVLVKGRG